MAPRGFDRYMVSLGMGTHPKFARLTDSEFRAHIVGVLALAAMSPVRGCLLVGNLPAEPADVAMAAGVPERVAASAIRKLEAVGVLERDEERDCLRVHHWDDSNPSPGAERTRRWRDGQRNNETSPDRHAGVTETHGQITAASPEVEEEGEKEANASFSRRANRDREKATEDDRQLCRLLAESARTHNPKLKIRSDSKWLRDMRLLRDRDSNSPEEIERLIGWVFSDASRDGSFWWADVIQSPGNLRAHFAQMWAKMRSSSLQAVPDVEDSTSFLARRGSA